MKNYHGNQQSNFKFDNLIWNTPVNRSFKSQFKISTRQKWTEWNLTQIQWLIKKISKPSKSDQSDVIKITHVLFHPILCNDCILFHLIGQFWAILKIILGSLTIHHTIHQFINCSIEGLFQLVFQNIAIIKNWQKYKIYLSKGIWSALKRLSTKVKTEIYWLYTVYCKILITVQIEDYLMAITKCLPKNKINTNVILCMYKTL